MITLKVGYKQQLGVLVKDVYGNVIENTVQPVWSFSNNELASVDESGLLTAGTVVGVGQVTAMVNDISGFLDVELIAGDPAVVEVIAVGEPTP